MSIRRSAIVVLAAVLLTAISLWLGRQRQRLKAYETAGRIQTLCTLLQVERPAGVTDAVLRGIAAKHRHSAVLVDAWGRPLEVVRAEGRYVASSAGRDGVFSGVMPAGQEATPDTDLIAVDGEWVQVWN